LRGHKQDREAWSRAPRAGSWCGLRRFIPAPPGWERHRRRDSPAESQHWRCAWYGCGEAPCWRPLPGGRPSLRSPPATDPGPAIAGAAWMRETEKTRLGGSSTYHLPASPNAVRDF
jgi:hypothetical protein